MDAKTEARQIFNEIGKIEFTDNIEFETGYSDVDVDLPDWVIKKAAIIVIDRMTHVKNSITEQYWKDVKTALNGL
jgi:hypothetical protein